MKKQKASLKEALKVMFIDWHEDNGLVEAKFQFSDWEKLLEAIEELPDDFIPTKPVNDVGRVFHPSYTTGAFTLDGVPYMLVMGDDYSGLDIGVKKDYGVTDGVNVFFQGDLGDCVAYIIGKGWNGGVK